MRSAPCQPNRSIESVMGAMNEVCDRNRGARARPDRLDPSPPARRRARQSRTARAGSSGTSSADSRCPAVARNCICPRAGHRPRRSPPRSTQSRCCPHRPTEPQPDRAEGQSWRTPALPLGKRDAHPTDTPRARRRPESISDNHLNPPTTRRPGHTPPPARSPSPIARSGGEAGACSSGLVTTAPRR